MADAEILDSAVNETVADKPQASVATSSADAPSTAGTVKAVAAKAAPAKKVARAKTAAPATTKTRPAAAKAAAKPSDIDKTVARTAAVKLAADKTRDAVKPASKPAVATVAARKPAARNSTAASAARISTAASAARNSAAASAARISTAASAALRKDSKMNTETLTKSFETQVAAMAPAVEKATQDAMAQAKISYDALNTKMRETMETSMKSMTEVTEFAKGNVEALVASAKAAAAGAEVLAARATETSKKSMDEAAVAIKAMTAAKTPNEFMQMQNDYAKTQFDAAVASWSHMSETMLKLAGDVVQPLSSRMAIAAETMKSAIVQK